MKELLPALAVALLAASALLGLSAGAPVAAQAPAPVDLTVSVNMTQRSTQLGETFKFSSTITNNSDAASGTLIANLNFVSQDRKTYIDPEDWSPDRTIEVGSIAAHSTAIRAWTVKPVVKGDVGAYVVVLPKSPELAASASPAASPVIHIHVQERRPLNPGGILPVALAVPAAVALAFAGLRAARRRL